MNFKILPESIELKILGENEKHILKNLWSLYVHDLSEYRETLNVLEDGTYPFPDFDLYFKEDYMHPILIKVDGKIGGFVLLTEPPYSKVYDYGIQEFFILKKYRKKGVGTQVINKIFKTYKGNYRYLILEKNIASRSMFLKLFKSSNIKYEEKLINLDELTKCYEYSVFIANE